MRMPLKRMNISGVRQQLPSVVERVARTGEAVLIVRRGKAIAKIVPAATEGDESQRPLRGLPIVIAPDFDEPLPDLWEALDE